MILTGCLLNAPLSRSGMILKLLLELLLVIFFKRSCATHVFDNLLSLRKVWDRSACGEERVCAEIVKKVPAWGRRIGCVVIREAALSIGL